MGLLNLFQTSRPNANSPFTLSITFGSWSKHDEHIGVVELPPDVNEADFLGAEKETRYDLICFASFD